MSLNYRLDKHEPKKLHDDKEPGSNYIQIGLDCSIKDILQQLKGLAV